MVNIRRAKGNVEISVKLEKIAMELGALALLKLSRSERRLFAGRAGHAGCITSHCAAVFLSRRRSSFSLLSVK
jgi:hypothetical protein